ncbi:MAG TPA: diaminopimelate epimerase [Vicinamibacterales bacterium]|jgi:diaminopimelate epimerase|nr:diaminopimelate epimerase [Vicinamibacterales bacterium]
MRFAKAHAYGNDFLYVDAAEAPGAALDALAREMCSRHTGVGADGLIVFTRAPDRTAMRLFNADGSRAEISGNGVRGLAALLLRERPEAAAAIAIETEAGRKQLSRMAIDGSRQTFRAAMGVPRALRQARLPAAGRLVDAVVLDIGNPQCVVLGPLPDEETFQRLGPALERHDAFPEGTNVEFAETEAPDRVRILIWERGVGPTESSGTGSCAALVAAAAFGGASRQADVVAPGGTQRVEWLDDGVYLTGWAEIVCDGTWLRQIPGAP